MRALQDRKFDPKDDFWAIEKLIPKVNKTRPTPIVRRESDVSAVEIISDAPEKPQGESKLTMLSTAKPVRTEESAPAVPDLEYIPISPLISFIKR